MKIKNIKLYIIILTIVALLGISGCTLSVSIGKRADTSDQEKITTEKDTSDENEVDAPSSEKEEVTEAELNESDTGEKNEGHKLVKNISADLNVREYPRHKSDLVAVVSSGQSMEFYGEIGQGYGSDEIVHDWYKIYLENGITGWVRSDLVTEADADSDLDQ